MTSQPQILFIDAYDSFAENIAGLLRRLFSADITTIKIDADLEAGHSNSLQKFLRRYDAIVLGPGPGHPNNPADTGVFSVVWKVAAEYGIPVLGICLGFQSLCTTFGLAITRLPLPCHGHAKRIHHKNLDIFSNSGEVIATCYNSLGAKLTPATITPDASRPASRASSISSESSSYFPSTEASAAESDGSYTSTFGDSLQVLACDDDGYIMAVRHRRLPFWGLQFHPESCKSTTACEEVLQSWWEKARLHNIKRRPSLASRDRPKVPRLANPIEPKASSSSLHTLDYLRSLTVSLANAVSFKTIPITCDRQQLAALCNSLSLNGSVAMLESARRGRFSIFAIPDKSTWSIEFQKGGLSIYRKSDLLHQQDMSTLSAMNLVQNFLTEKSVVKGPQDIPFWGGFVGFFSYEAGLDLLKVSTGDVHHTRTVPDFSLVWVDRSIAVDHQENCVFIQTIREGDRSWVEEIASKVSKLDPMPPSTPHLAGTTHPRPISKSLPSHQQYISQIRSCQSSLHAGDSYELCLTTSATLVSTNSPFALYSNLQHSNPAPYSAYLHLNHTHIVSSSPEQFLSWFRSEPRLDMMPMKGTLSKTPTINTVERAREILLNPKEEAENLMIADLIRHDLHSAVGPNGSVTVEKLFEVVETESLYQLISHIRGHIPPLVPRSLKTSLTPADISKYIMSYGHKALRTALPPGSMTGAPKKRSCEILRSLEQRNRGVYSGIIGYFDVGGGGAWSVAIRCAFSHSSEDQVETGGDGTEERVKKWHIGAGGAITVLSEEEAEWEEMRAKMGSVLRGFGVDD